MSLYNFFQNACFDNKCNNVALCASEWYPLTAYYANNIVTLCGSVWICARDSINNKPHIGSPYWTLLCVSCKVNKCEPCVPYQHPPPFPPSVPCYPPVACYPPVPCYPPLKSYPYEYVVQEENPYHHHKKCNCESQYKKHCNCDSQYKKHCGCKPKKCHC